MDSITIDYTEHMTVLNFLRGKKTYIIGALMIVLGYLQGDTQMMLEGFGLMTLRAGISKT